MKNDTVDWSKSIQTRSGLPAKVIDVINDDGEKKYVVKITKGPNNHFVRVLLPEGRAFTSSLIPHEGDIINTTVENTGYLNLYITHGSHYVETGFLYSSEDEAIANRRKGINVTSLTIPITWSEPRR